MNLPDPLPEFAPLYRMFARRLGWHPRQVDRLEVWEAAHLLGLTDDTPPVVLTVAPAGGASSDGEGEGSSLDDGRAMAVARVKASREGRPPPTWYDDR